MMNREQIEAAFGRFVAKEMGMEDIFQKFLILINPQEIMDEPTDEPAPKKTRGEKRKAAKETARKVVYATANKFQGTETDTEILIRIVAKHPEIRLRNENENHVHMKEGVLTCENAALWMIHKSADNGKLFDETLDVAIAAHLHENGNGLCAPTLLMIWRILALHNYNHSKVKEALIEILQKDTVNAITVLAKATEKYTQRNVHDQRVLYLEEKLAENPGVKNQMK